MTKSKGIFVSIGLLVATMFVVGWEGAPWGGGSDSDSGSGDVSETDIDTFAELDALVADKSLVNEEDAVTWDSTHNFSSNIAVSGTVYVGVDGNGYTVLFRSDIPGDYMSWDETTSTLAIEGSNGVPALILNDGDLTVSSGDLAVTGTISVNGDLTIHDGSHEVIVPTNHPAQIFVFDPDTIQATRDAIPLLYVDAVAYPAGVVIEKVWHRVDVTNSYVCAFEEWTNSTGAAVAQIETTTNVSSTTASSTAIDNPTIEAGNSVYIDLPTTDVDMLEAGIVYRIVPN